MYALQVYFGVAIGLSVVGALAGLALNLWWSARKRAFETGVQTAAGGSAVFERDIRTFESETSVVLSRFDETQTFEPAQTPLATVSILTGDQAGRHIQLRADTVLGRDPRQGGFEIRDRQLGVSREHAEIRLQDQDFVIYDLHSRNGTWVNAAQVVPPGGVRLVDGDQIKLGPHVLLEFRGPEGESVPRSGGDSPIRNVGSYPVEELLGEGGMGSVLKARSPTGKSSVVIKLAPAEWSDALLRESNVLRSLRHHNIARVLPIATQGGGSDVYVDVQDIGGKPHAYLVMEYLEGGSLSGWLGRQGQISLSKAVDIGRQIAEALCYLHRKNVVHLDIKPSNILLSRDGGRVVLTDFGIARAANELEQSPEGGTAGTLGYAAPERLYRSAPPNARADVYSLGTVLYELLTGRLPFSGNTPAEVMEAAVNDTAHQPPSTHNPQVPPALDDVVMRCLRKDRDSRPTPEELLGALRRISRQLPKLTP